MKFSIGDYVTRSSHQNDIVFRIVKIEGNVAYLKGLNVRLVADSYLSDLVEARNVNETDDEIIDQSVRDINLDRSDYFYIPGVILHVDGDEEYLDRCMNFYHKMHVKANGIYIPEPEMSTRIPQLLEEYHPDILVLTGHDAYYRQDKYQYSSDYIDAVKEARKYEKNQDKLIVIAGACQSNYEDLIKSGANFASSPKRINIHALDPALIAVSIAFSDKNKTIDLLPLIQKTKFGSDGMGGIITNGTMYVGYPR
ncbi:MAG: sporulation peptidase YabG [Bacilli bacterium]|nr:sporulation peptidase YabG [Bacilli bacterium]